MVEHVERMVHIWIEPVHHLFSVFFLICFSGCYSLDSPVYSIEGRSGEEWERKRRRRRRRRRKQDATLCAFKQRRLYGTVNQSQISNYMPS
ncbi:hypothetical protein PP714_08600, partial [Lacticaseibacillus paracasei]|nr:hypothetical protein [Lacticaseibacillus paracasei]